MFEPMEFNAYKYKKFWYPCVCILNVKIFLKHFSNVYMNRWEWMTDFQAASACSRIKFTIYSQRFICIQHLKHRTINTNTNEHEHCFRWQTRSLTNIHAFNMNASEHKHCFLLRTRTNPSFLIANTSTKRKFQTRTNTEILLYYWLRMKTNTCPSYERKREWTTHPLCEHKQTRTNFAIKYIFYERICLRHYLIVNQWINILRFKVK